VVSPTAAAPQLLDRRGGLYPRRDAAAGSRVGVLRVDLLYGVFKPTGRNPENALPRLAGLPGRGRRKDFRFRVGFGLPLNHEKP
jgi:hypothetical protein